MPIYYRNKIYTEEEKEELWIKKLDEQTRYINGIKIDISKDEEDYYRVLADQRILNSKLGYGDNKKDWKKHRYEQERRNLIKQERIEKYKELKAKEQPIKNSKSVKASPHLTPSLNDDIKPNKSF